MQKDILRLIWGRAKKERIKMSGITPIDTGYNYYYSVKKNQTSEDIKPEDAYLLPELDSDDSAVSTTVKDPSLGILLLPFALFARCSGERPGYDRDARNSLDAQADAQIIDARTNDAEIVDAETPDACIGTMRITNASGWSYYPSLVWTGDEYGVSWTDTRDDGYNNIYFRRISATGVPIGTDVPITSASSDSVESSLVWTGDEYGVSWADSRDGNYEIYFTRISEMGIPIETDMRITNANGASYGPSLTWTGSEYGVSWQDYRDGNYEIYFKRISDTGIPIGTDVRITNANGDSVANSLVWTGSDYGVSWGDDRHANSENYNSEIYFRRISAIGVPIGTDVRVTNDSNWSEMPSIVWTGSDYGVSWEDNRDGNSEIYFRRISAIGVPIGTDMRITNASGFSGAPSIVWTGSEYGVSWHYYRDGNYEIYFKRISEAGIPIGTDIRITNASGDSGDPSLVWTGSEYGVSWGDYRDGNYEIYFARIGCLP